MRPGTSKSAWINFKLKPLQTPHYNHTTRRSISTDVAPRMSTVHQGNAFEERSLALLHKTMSMSLKRVGGREDGGIDLLGWWWLPSTTINLNNTNSSLLKNHYHHHHHARTTTAATASSNNRRRIRVIGQCKAEKKKLGPKFVRELEGVLFRFLTTSSLDVHKPPDPDFNHPDASQLPIVALLMSESAFTKSAILRANSSPIPFFLMHLPAVDNSDDTTDADGIGDLGMALCNPALCGRDGLLKGNMELRWERRGLGGDGRGRPAVWWGNQKLHSWTPELVTSKLDGAREVLHDSK